MLTFEQLENNRKLDEEIKSSELEHKLYVAECDAKRAQYKKDHPNNPYANLMFLAVKSKRCVVGIRYVE